MDGELDHYLKVCEVARLLRVSPDSVRRWIVRGQLQAVRDRLTGRYLVPRQAVLARLEVVRSAPDLRPARLLPTDPRTAAVLARYGITLGPEEG